MTTLRNAVSQEDHVAGPSDAPVTVVEYGDYECPYCGAAYPVVKQLQRKFGDRLRFVFRNFPLTQLHPNAMGAACTAEYSAGAGKFWEVHDALFEQQQHLSMATFEAISDSNGLDVSGLRQALADGRFEAGVRREFTSGLRSGVNRTPTFFVQGVRFDTPDYRYLAWDLGQAIESAAETGDVR